MKDFFSKKKNIVMIAILAVLIVVAGIVCAIKFNKPKQQVSSKTNKQVVIDKAKKDIIGEETKEEKDYEEKYTKQYEEYEKLSEDEKKKSKVIPKKYDVSYDIINDIIKDQKEDKKQDNKNGIPSKFNLSDKIKIKVEDQGAYNLCWDFAATKCLETNLALTQKKEYDFSEMHVNYVTSDLLCGNREVDEGGDFSTYEDYLINSGVVLENDVKYKSYNENDYEKFLEYKPVVNVTKTVNFPTINKLEENLTNKELEKFRETVKKHIMNYGSLYAQVSMEDYNSNTNTLYTTKDSDGYIDHAITIVGWDDNYSKDNFAGSSKPKNNGAYIALNSWGESFGDKGYFYISYDDLYVESGMSGIVSTSLKDAYNVDDIKNQEIKNIIMQELSNTLITDKSKEYVTELALSKIYELDLSNNKEFNSLKDIDIFKNLYEINLSNTNITDISKLKEVKELYCVDLSNTKIKDVSALKDCTGLEILNLENDKGIKGYEEITSLANLNISNCDIKDVQELSNLKELVEVNLSGNKNVKNISELSNLTSIYLKDTGIKSIKEIENLTNLSVLDLSYNELTSIDGIANLKELTNIDLSGNKITDFSNISLLKNNYSEEEYPYISLTVESGEISDISIFNDISNIAELYLANNNITDLSNFNNNSVCLLDLSGNIGLTNIIQLKNMEDLNVLYLENCDLNDLSEIAELKNIDILDLSGNDIKNIEKLNNLELGALSLESNKNIEGKLNINSLLSLNLSNTDIDSKRFDFSNCKELYEINLSGCNSKELMNKVIDKISDYGFIYTDEIELDLDKLETIKDKNIKIPNAKITIKTSEDDSVSIKDNTINIKNNKTLRKMIMTSINNSGVSVIGGKLNKNLVEIEKTTKEDKIEIVIDYTVKIILDYSETNNNNTNAEETEENNNSNVSNKKDKKDNKATENNKSENKTEDNTFTMTED